MFYVKIIKFYKTNEDWVSHKCLSGPSKPADKAFQELVWIMTNHQDSVVKRFEFNNHDWKPEESLGGYIAELRQLTEHCNYGTILQDMLQDCMH